MTRIVVGEIEIALRPGYMWIENGRVEDHQMTDLRAALDLAQQELWRQT